MNKVRFKVVFIIINNKPALINASVLQAAATPTGNGQKRKTGWNF